MSIPTKFKEYIWLVNTIRRARRITFAEINERWLETEMSGLISMSLMRSLPTARGAAAVLLFRSRRCDR